jgi:hypothetical protein
LQGLSAEGAIGAQRNALLASAYADAGRYSDAADTLLAIPANQNMISKRSAEDAARLLRNAPTKVSTPETLPELNGILNFVYAHIGASSRVLESPERNVEIGYAISTPNRGVWLPLYVPLRKTERFKAYARKAGLVDYWRARGWPDLCHPVGADDFVCN